LSIRKDDLDALVSCICDVLSLLSKREVFDEHVHLSAEGQAESLYSKSSRLNYDMMMFASRFKNSGIEMVYNLP